MKADLHVHTSISDGSYTTSETLDMARQQGITHIGIVNHDTISGLKAAVELGKRVGIKVIPGIEISSYDFINKRKVHILGYNFDFEGKNIRRICDPILKRRDENSRAQMKILIENGYKIDTSYIEEKCSESEVLYKQHIMSGMIKAGYTDNIYSDLYRDLFKNGGICDQDIEYIDVIESVKAIKADGGIAILAHPGQLNSYDIIPVLLEKGLDGIEVNHHSHSVEDMKKIIRICEMHNLIMTGGTDFHGEYGETSMIIGNIESPKEFLSLF